MIMPRLVSLRPAFAFLAGLAALTAAAPLGYAAEIRIPLDQVRIITFQKPVKTVFVGNPVIADITVIDPLHVFLLGKNFGTTNIVALDGTGHETANEQITVLDRPGSVVTLQRGPGQTTLNCTSSRCEAAPTPGDEPTPFAAVTGEIDRREALSLKAAGGQ
jgi:hypothetical protein